MKLLEAIKKVLGVQVQGCRQMLDLLQREKVCLLDLQMKEVETIIKEKDSLVLKLRLLEEERKRLLDHFIRENPQTIPVEQSDPQKISLRNLAELTGETIFLEMRSKLISLSQGINELNDLNKVMIDRTLGFLKQNNNFLRMYFPGAAPLGEKGRLLSREI